MDRVFLMLGRGWAQAVLSPALLQRADAATRRVRRAAEAMASLDPFRRELVCDPPPPWVARLTLHQRVDTLGLLDDLARFIERLLAQPPEWRRRLRRCRYLACDRPYFFDPTDAGVKRFCTEAHRKAHARQRTAAPRT